MRDRARTLRGEDQKTFQPRKNLKTSKFTVKERLTVRERRVRVTLDDPVGSGGKDVHQSQLDDHRAPREDVHQ